MSAQNSQRRFTPDETLDRWFGYNRPGSEAVADAHQLIRGEYRQLADVLQGELPEGPDKTIALQSLRRAMWAANAAVACNHPDNFPDGPAV